MLAISTALSAVVLASLSSRVRAANHTIVVGGAAGLVYTPSNITADVGDFVTFIFQTKNHTVTQSGFATPCTRLENATLNAIGFDSDFAPVKPDDQEFPAYTIQIEATSPIWFYCRQGNHCQQGMVGSINAALTGNKTFEAFKANAMGPAGTATTVNTATLGTVLAVTAPTSTGIGVNTQPSGSAGGAEVSSALGAAAISSPQSSSMSTNKGGYGSGAAMANMKTPTVAGLLAVVAGLYALLL